MSELGKDILTGFRSVGSDWKKAKKTSDKNDRVSKPRLDSMRYYKPVKLTMKDVAYMHMEEAYNKASSNGRYYANARQIMYACRPFIIARLGKHIWGRNSDSYFTQTILKDYIEDRGDHMKVVWDARGHLIEPHTNYKIGLGGAEVMKYRQEQTGEFSEIEQFDLKTIAPTRGPKNRYGAVLFVEKEGFHEQLEDAGITKRWDIAIMSSKGVPNAATCNVGAMVGVPVMALHDFDVAGFKIVKTLRQGTRLSHGIRNVIDIGLRLEDVEGMEPEPVFYRTNARQMRWYLRFDCNATLEEIDYLVNQRVEINMLTTEELINFLEKKFEEHGIKKIIPEEDTLRSAFKRANFRLELEKQAKILEEHQQDWEIPDNLLDRVKDSLDEDPSQSWDEAVWDIAEEYLEGKNDKK